MIRGSLISASMLALTMALFGGACSDDTQPPVDLGPQLDGARDGARDLRSDGVKPPDGRTDSRTDGPRQDGPRKDGPSHDIAPLPDKGPQPDGCGQCRLSIYRINGSTTMPAQLSSLNDQDPNTAGIQINVDVSADCTADGTDVELAVTGLTPTPKVKISGGYASFTNVTVAQSVGVVALTPTSTGCGSTPQSFNVVRDPTCSFTKPVDGSTLTSKDDAIPNNGTFEYTLVAATQYATGGTVTASIINGASLGSAPVAAGTGDAQFTNQVFANGLNEVQANVEITVGGQKITKPCLANGKTKLSFTVDTTAPACTIVGFTPAAINTPNGPGLGPLQDADANPANGLQTTVTVNTDNGKATDVTLTVGGQSYGPKSTSTGSVTFDITVADGAPSFRATCTNTATGNQAQSGVTKVIVDTAAPPAITDLACFVDLTVSNHRRGILTCDWTTADDGATGSGVASYTLNCDKNALITVAGFDTAPIKNPGLLPTPTPKQTREVSGLNIPNSYSCAVQVVDALGNKSAVSNITTLTQFAFQVQEIQGTVPGGGFGTPIVAGDFNCDGLSDVAVGVHKANGDIGEVQIFFSNGSTFSTTPQRITGTRANGRFGIFLAALDYDGRTFNVGGVQRKCMDLAIASYNPVKQTPRVYVFFGRPAFGARTDEGVGTGAEIIYSAGATDTFATVLGSADIDGDGFGDLVMTHKTSAETNLRLLVHYGNNAVPVMTISGTPVQIAMPGSADINLEGNATVTFGIPIKNAGKLGSSSHESILFGSSFEPNTAGGTGRAYLMLGQARATGPETATLASSRIVRIDGDANSKFFGAACAGVGDLNKDGINEFAVADPWVGNGTSTRAGAIYVFDLATGPTMSLADAKAVYTNDIGDNTDDWFGRSLANVPAGAGSADLSGDGIDDLVAGSFRTGAATIATGYIFSGATGALLPRSTTTPNISFSAPSGATNSFGSDLILLIDVNGDGFGDLLAGEFAYSSNLGRFVVYY